MGRQWLHAKRAIASLKKGRTNAKLVREIMVAAKLGGADPDLNARLATAVDKARKESVSRDVIERAIKKGAGTGDEKLVLEHTVFEGYAPHKVPVIVEVMTDNVNRTAPEIRLLFRKGQLGNSGCNKFLFEPVGLVEAHHPDPQSDREAAAIEAGAAASPQVVRQCRPMAEGRYAADPVFSTALRQKDASYGLALAESQGVASPLGAAATEWWSKASTLDPGGDEAAPLWAETRGVLTSPSCPIPFELRQRLLREGVRVLQPQSLEARLYAAALDRESP